MAIFPDWWSTRHTAPAIVSAWMAATLFPIPRRDFSRKVRTGRRRWWIRGASSGAMPVGQACELEGQVIYELHIGTFTREGTWEAARRELPELAAAGITVVELMPVADFPGQFGWGYDGVGWFAPVAIYGEPDDFRRFVDDAHARRHRCDSGRGVQPPGPGRQLPPAVL